MSPDFCVLAHRSVHVNPHKQEDIQLQSPDDSTKVNQPAKNNPLIQRWKPQALRRQTNITKWSNAQR